MHSMPATAAGMAAGSDRPACAGFGTKPRMIKKIIGNRVLPKRRSMLRVPCWSDKRIQDPIGMPP
jgi:hypothetical protein